MVGTLLALGVVFAITQPGEGAAVALGIWAVVGGLLLFGNERSRVITSEEGLTCVPFAGRCRRYAWSEINGFTVHRIPGGRYGGPAVSMSLTDRSVFLRPTMRRDGARETVQRIADGLNADLDRFRAGRIGA